LASDEEGVIAWENTETMENLLVMKFGGTSMGSAERMRVAAGLITREKRPVVAVVEQRKSARALR